MTEREFRSLAVHEPPQLDSNRHFEASEPNYEHTHLVASLADMYEFVVQYLVKYVFHRSQLLY